MKDLTLVGVAGSLRENSYNTALLERIKEEVENEGASLHILEIGDLPLFNEELEEDFPEKVSALKEKIKASDGAIVLTPEYNRSVSGVLKNAVDWTSRPYGDSAWGDKPVFVGGGSLSQSGAMIAQSHLKHTFLHLNARVLGQPEFFVGGVNGKFNEAQELSDKGTEKLIQNSVKAFGDFIKG
jgi:chromate reductase